MQPMSYPSVTPRRYVPKIRSSELAELLIEQTGRCWHCSTPLRLPFERDHLVPVSRGGCDERHNVVLSCRPCNHDKADLKVDEWHAYAAVRDPLRDAELWHSLTRKESSRRQRDRALRVYEAYAGRRPRRRRSA